MMKPESVDYDSPATTDRARDRLARERGRDLAAMAKIRFAAQNLINDIRKRYPGEPLRALDDALQAEFETDKKVLRQLYGEHAGIMIGFAEAILTTHSSEK
jgi:uncharacterized ferritin-like protein (DUF455 family)